MTLENSVLSCILQVWTTVLEWIGGAFTKLEPIFYNAETGLTVVGVLSVSGVAVGVVLLFLMMIKSWMSFR